MAPRGEGLGAGVRGEIEAMLTVNDGASVDEEPDGLARVGTSEVAPRGIETNVCQSCAEHWLCDSGKVVRGIATVYANEKRKSKNLRYPR